MNVLVIGQDPLLFDSDSEVSRRIAAYAEAIGALEIVVFTRPGHASVRRGSVSIHPTNSRSVLFRVWDAMRIAVSLIRTRRIHLIDAQDSGEAGLAAFLASRRTGIPFRLQIHTDVMSPWYRRASWKEFVRYLLARFLIPRADCVRVVSERIARSFITNYQLPITRITVLPIFTDISKFRDAESDPATTARFQQYDFRMVAVGRFVDKEKNFSMLIQMMRSLTRSHPNVVLVLVGDGPDKENYTLHITNYKLEKNVILERSRDDLPSFLKSFDLFLLSSNFEGWGRVAVEAMASGLPVVMTDVGLAGEVVRHGENGLIVPVGDLEGFEGACDMMIRDPSRRARMAAVGRETVLRSTAPGQAAYLEAYRTAFFQCLS